MELTGLPDTVMGTLKVEKHKPPEDGVQARAHRPAGLHREDPHDVGPRPRALQHLARGLLGLEVGEARREPERPSEVEGPAATVARAERGRHAGAEDGSECGSVDEDARERVDLGAVRTQRPKLAPAIEPRPAGDPRRAAGEPPRRAAGEGRDRARRRTTGSRTPAAPGPHRSSTNAAPERPGRRTRPVDEDAGKGAPPQYDLPALDQANDTAQAMGFRARTKPVETRPPPAPRPRRRRRRTIWRRRPEWTFRRRPFAADSHTEVTPARADLKISRDLHVVHRAPGTTARTTRGAPTEPPSPATMDSSSLPRRVHPRTAAAAPAAATGAPRRAERGRGRPRRDPRPLGDRAPAIAPAPGHGPLPRPRDVPRRLRQAPARRRHRDPACPTSTRPECVPSSASSSPRGRTCGAARKWWHSCRRAPASSSSCDPRTKSSSGSKPRPSQRTAHVRSSLLRSGCGPMGCCAASSAGCGVPVFRNASRRSHGSHGAPRAAIATELAIAAHAAINADAPLVPANADVYAWS